VQIIIEDTNYKDQLLRKFQALYHVPPRYKEIAVVGPPHDRIFTMGVLDPNDKILTTATARNKKVAEQEASRMALELLEPTLQGAAAPVAYDPPPQMGSAAAMWAPPPAALKAGSPVIPESMSNAPKQFSPNFTAKEKIIRRKPKIQYDKDNMEQ
jgi:hypothetical protein